VSSGINRPLAQLLDLLGLGMIGEKLKKVVEVIVGAASRFENRHWSPFDRLRPAIGHRGGEVAGVEPIAVLWVGGGEVVEGLNQLTSHQSIILQFDQSLWHFWLTAWLSLG
jgi:hypothetical protein